MKVLRVLNELRPSGVEVSLAGSAGLWSARGIHNEILAIGAEQGPYASALEGAGYRVHHIPLRPFSSFVPAYLRLLRAASYDVVHIHAELANFYIALISRLSHVPVVVRSVHSIYPFTFYLRFQRRMQRRLLRLMGVMHVSISDTVQRGEWESLRNPSVKINNWYDDSRFPPRSVREQREAREAFGLDDSTFAVTTVGNCRHLKNHRAVIEALSLIPGELSITYLHAGLEEPAHPERSLANRLGVTDRIQFLGRLDDIPGLLAAADCFVMPSLYEGFGNAALEALGRGVPSVLADVRGLADFKPYFPQAVFVPPTPQGLANGIRGVAALDSQTRSELARQLTLAAQQHFNAEGAVGQYANLYFRLVDAKRRRPPVRQRARDAARRALSRPV